MLLDVGWDVILLCRDIKASVGMAELVKLGVEEILYLERGGIKLNPLPDMSEEHINLRIQIGSSRGVYLLVG